MKDEAIVRGLRDMADNFLHDPQLLRRAATRIENMAKPPEVVSTKAILNAMQDHYWDSLEPQREIVMKHVEGVLRLFEQSQSQSSEDK